ncbi:hypothetical protein [Pseudomonas citrulli]|uniref:Uncharacterized protein n=1 Tax=Pseudomonas citrulli TaxID=3064347 RepID=A0ABT9C025_9PSED|nr:hypothetical protein [Pseudomonas sp. K18]MDO7896938.1 hypothetical protein [Pseudomonas sp. K18]
MEDACAALRRREQIPEDRRDGIGVLRTSKMAVGTIAEWARARQLDAVIWTALPPRFNGMEGQVPSADEAIAYLANLTGEARDHAREYIRMTPEQIDTPYRRELVRRLGWH